LATLDVSFPPPLDGSSVLAEVSLPPALAEAVVVWKTIITAQNITTDNIKAAFIVVVVDKWLLFRGGLYHTFDYTILPFATVHLTFIHLVDVLEQFLAINLLAT